MTERKRRMRTTSKERLERAGFEFEQIPETETDAGKWRVWLPITGRFDDLHLMLPKVYKHLTTAVSAGLREIERVKIMRDSYGNISEDWERALAKFDDES